LNWQEDDFFREEHANTGFVDYIFKIGKRNIFVVEAKKKGLLFTMPITFGFRRQFSLRGILSTDKDIKKVIRQARSYCNDKGARFGIVSNGDQFIIFEANRPGEDWEKGKCLVFYNLDDIRRNFKNFWNLLSKDAVERGSLIERLARDVEEFKFVRPVDDIHFKNESQPRNQLYRYMIPLIRYAFKDITDDIDMLKKCYVLEDEFKEFGLSMKDQFSNSITKNNEFKIIVEGPETAGIFLADFYKYAEMLQRTPPEPILFLLLGRIGSGKTTFIHRFFNVVLDEEERKKIKCFYINFKDAPTEEQNIRDYIFKSILGDFNARHKDLLTSILKILKMESVSPNLEGITKLFLILKYEGYIPSLVFDNVDQHRVESSTFHEKVFLEANNLTKDLRTITIMTLREESFYRSALYGVFDAYNIEQYVIIPPNLRKVLLYRLNYILEKLNLSPTELKQLLTTHLDFESRSEDIKEFLEILKDTIYKKPRRGVSRFISRTQGGDIRKSLEVFSRFLISGNTKVREILETHRREGSYTIAEHQFIKSIVLGNYRYYSEEYTYLMNIFDFNVEFSNSHFLKLRILKYAEDHINNDSPFGRGYVSINRLKEEARKLSISLEAIEDSLMKMAKHRLILLNTRSRKDLENASHFIITECGNYYLNNLINRFSYIDLVIADTPVADTDLIHEIRSMLPSKRLDIRFKRVEKFLHYLNEMEKMEHNLNPEYQTSSLCRHRYTAKMLSSFQKEKQYITQRIAEKTHTL